MSKLKNIKAVNEMLRGSHRSQTKATVGFEKDQSERIVGDEWVDANGQKWIQKDGYKSKVSRFDKIRKLINTNDCPNCKKKLSRFDHQFVTRENKCHDCVVKEETLMLCEGYVKGEDIYGNYERQKIQENVESFSKEAEQEVDIIKNTFTQMDFVNSDGKVEKWKLPESVDSINEKIQTQFESFKDDLREQARLGSKYNELKSEKEDEQS